MASLLTWWVDMKRDMKSLYWLTSIEDMVGGEGVRSDVRVVGGDGVRGAVGREVILVWYVVHHVGLCCVRCHLVQKFVI